MFFSCPFKCVPYGPYFSTVVPRGPYLSSENKFHGVQSFHRESIYFDLFSEK